ncbi:MAG TPA: aminotransferase class IV [Kofleriaceae bacterium]|nr:aminotransferase class IV [Kofleriaceae bacterium]
MSVRVFINDRVTDGHQAAISVFDRGFLYGDSVYEVLRTSAGEPVDFAAHLSRLSRSAAAIALALPPEDDIREAVITTLAAAENPDSYIRIVVTRGAGDIGLATELADRAALIVIVKPLTLPDPALYARGARLAIVGVVRTPRRAMDPAVKSGNYLNNIMALAEARRAGADEAVMCDGDDRIAEGASSNVFVVRDGQVTTPALEVGLLAGITRGRVIELLRTAGIAVTEGVLSPAEVRLADEVFITSSIRSVMPVAHIDDQALPAPIPGPITREAMALYRRRVLHIAS